MNPYTIIAAGILIIGLSIGSYTIGHSNGVNTQKVKDQAEFSRIDKELTKQKEDAAALLDQEIKKGIELTNKNQELIAQGVKDHEEFRKTTADLNRKYNTLKLRFATTSTTTGDSSNSTKSKSGEAVSGTTTTTIVSLPDVVTRDLRQLTTEADNWLGWYRKCYNYVEQVDLSN